MKFQNGTISPGNAINREDSLHMKSKTHYYNKTPKHRLLKSGLQSNYKSRSQHRPLSPWPSSKVHSSMNTTVSHTVPIQRSATPHYHNVPSISDSSEIVRRQQHLEMATNHSRTKRAYKHQYYNNQSNNSKHNEWYGDELTLNKGWETGEYTDTIRLCSININGIAQDLDWIEWDLTLQNMYSQQIDVLGLTEPNINFKNAHVKSKLYDIARGFERNTQFSTSCSNQLRTTKKKQGGTMTILSGRWAGRKNTTVTDPYGRWSSITLVGKKEKEITIITAYRVCQQKGGEGCTVFHQQQLDFEQKGQRMVNLRKRFCQDLTQFIRSLHEKGQIVILMGDFNEDFNVQGNQINTMLKDCGLVNMFHKAHGTSRPLPTTYDRGTKCIDMIAITDSIHIPKSCIKRVGYMPFYHIFQSDHRAVYCDIDTSILFGSLRHASINSSTRPFTTKNIKQCNKFKETVRKLYKKSKIFQGVNSLNKRFKNANEEDLQQIIVDCQKLGDIAGQLLLCAGRKVGKKKYSHGKPFSDKLNTIAKQYHEEKTNLRWLRKHRSTQSAKEEKDSIERIKMAYKELRKIQSEADKARNDFLEEIAEKRAGEWKMTTAAALNIIIQSEASKRTYARHGNVMKPNEKGSIRTLMVPVPQYRDTLEATKKVEWMEIEDDQTIYYLLLKRNAQQLMRSANSPFAKGTLVDGCGFDGEKEMTTRILSDALTNHEKSRIRNENASVQDELDQFIRALAQPKNAQGNPIANFQWEYGVKEFRATFQKTRESTACGPSGLNMSYWKACAEDDDIAQVQAFFIEKAFQYGFSYKRWQTSWHCMLKKDETPYLHRLRIIQLFEGDFNGALKYLLGRLLMHHVVNTKQCDDQAFGSIPGRTAHGALITLQLLYDNARVTKRTTASIFNDAAGCYDRIRSLLCYLCMVRVGCPEGIAQCHSITQREMTHHVKTCRGASTDNIKWGPNQDLYTQTSNGVRTTYGNIGGIGQGGGGSPIGWLAVLLVMIQTYSKFTSGVQLTDPLGLYSLSLFLISYVDDNTLVQGFNSNDSMPTILGQLQFCLTKWHNILKITGGDLALEKCTFCLMKWKWSGHKATLETITTAPGEIKVNGTSITRLEPNRGTRVLGVRMAMDGSFKDELKYRQQQSKQMANTLYQSWLSTTDAYMVYETRYCPAMEYPLPVTMFSKKELESIQKPFIHLLLPKIGLNRHTPLAVIHGPQFRGGLGLRNLEEQQVCKHFEMFQGHIRRNDKLGISLRIQIIAQQLETGCGGLFLNTNPNIYSYTTPRTRLGYLWKQCFRFSIKISLSNVWIPGGAEGEDMTIMDHIVTLFPPERKKRTLQLQRINACRLYLKVMWVRDLFLSPDSLEMDTDLINGNKINENATLQFPEQARPSQADFTLWKDCVHRSLCIYRPNHITGGTLVTTFLRPRPNTSDPAAITSDYRDILRAITTHDTLEAKFQNLPIIFKDIIGDIQLPPDNGVQLITALKRGSAALASDGSYMEEINKGTHAYKLVDRDHDDGCIFGAATSPGSDKMSSSPTEQYGAIAVLVILIVLLQYHQEDGYKWPTVVLYIDNAEVVDRGNTRTPQFRNVGQFLTHDYDLWMVLSNLQSNLLLKVDFEWVRGHQAAVLDTGNLDAILLNNDVDRLATLQYDKRQNIPERGAFKSGGVCFHQMGFHVQNIYNAISSRESDNVLLDYYKTHGWREDTLALVDWMNIGKFLSRCHPIERCNVIQTMHDWQNTGHQKRQFYKASAQNDNTASSDTSVANVGLCPLHCGCIEVPFHYMHCKSDLLSQSRQKGKIVLKKALQRIHTAPSLLEAIITGLTFWEDETEYELDEDSNKFLFNPLHSQLLDRQNQIGWERFTKGFVAKDWGYIQVQYYLHEKKVKNKKFTKNGWVTQLLRLLHHYRHSVWKTRNQILHGGTNKEQRLFTRTQMQDIVRELYSRKRTQLPYAERHIFKLPLQLRLKQGSQQLKLWIQRVQLLFKTYYNTPTVTSQQSRITDWFQTGARTTLPMTVTQDESDSDTIYTDTASARETTEKGFEHSSTNLTNWLKSWSEEESTQDDINVLGEDLSSSLGF